MNHTPGPWEARELIPDGAIIRRGGTYELWTPDYDVAANVPHGGPFRKKADAVLAATAPALLAACKEAETALLLTTPRSPQAARYNQDAIATIRAAIAQAEEKAQ